MIRVIFVLAAFCIVCGCGKQKDETLAKRTGNKVGEVLTDFTTGVGRGIDSQMLIDVELSPEITEKGFSKTIAKLNGIDVDRSISIYLISKESFTGSMMAKAIDKQSQEIGRSVVPVEFETDDAKYVTFKFQKETDMQLIDKFCIYLK